MAITQITAAEAATITTIELQQHAAHKNIIHHNGAELVLITVKLQLRKETELKTTGTIITTVVLSTHQAEVTVRLQEVRVAETQVAVPEAEAGVINLFNFRFL